MSILVIADHDNASIKGATLNVIAAAKQIGGDVDVLVAGNGCGAAGESAVAASGGDAGVKQRAGAAYSL